MQILSQKRIVAERDVAEIHDLDLNLAKVWTNAEITLSSPRKKLGEYYYISATPETSSASCQLRQQYTNDKVHRLVLWDLFGKNILSWTTLYRNADKLAGSFPCRGLYGGIAGCYALAEEPISNRSDDILEFELADNLRLISKDTVNRIKGFASLEDNWDSYGAKVIEPSTIAKAIDCFSAIVPRLPKNSPLPFVAPVCNGDIYFEWEMISKTLVHSIPEEEKAPWEYLLIHKTSGKIKREPGEAINMQEMIEVVLDEVGTHAAERTHSQ